MISVLFYYLYTNKKESLLTWTANSTQGTEPIETYDTPFDSSCHVEQTGGMRFPKFFALFGLNPGNDWVNL